MSPGIRLPVVALALGLLLVPSHGVAAEPAPTEDETNLRMRQSACDYGAALTCFGLGRTTITALFIELEDARINYRPAVSTRTGLHGGWWFGVKFGVDLWDWVPLHVGVRHASPNDSHAFSQSVMNCTQAPGAAPVCDEDWHNVDSSAGAVFLSAETGLEPSCRLARGLALSPALLFGYAGTVWEFKRRVTNCVDCNTEPLDVDGSATYLAPSLRLTWGVLALAFRYERYLGGDLQDAIAIAFDFGVRYKAVYNAIPGER